MNRLPFRRQITKDMYHDERERFNATKGNHCLEIYPVLVAGAVNKYRVKFVISQCCVVKTLSSGMVQLYYVDKKLYLLPSGTVKK